MGKLIASNWTTADGYIAGPSGEMDWILGDEQMGAYELGLVGNASAMVFGGTTYREFSQHWPRVPHNPQAHPFERAFADKINPLSKIVYSTTLAEPLWSETSILRSVDPEEIGSIKDASEGDLVMYGSASLVPQLVRHKLIDEFHIIVHPLLLGGGLPYFSGIADRTRLTRIDCRPLDSGATILVFGTA